MNEDQYLISAKPKTLREDSRSIGISNIRAGGNTQPANAICLIDIIMAKHSLTKLIFFVGHG
jgi:hypothetical protein